MESVADYKGRRPFGNNATVEPRKLIFINIQSPVATALRAVRDSRSNQTNAPQGVGYNIREPIALKSY